MARTIADTTRGVTTMRSALTQSTPSGSAKRAKVVSAGAPAPAIPIARPRSSAKRTLAVNPMARRSDRRSRLHTGDHEGVLVTDVELGDVPQDARRRFAELRVLRAPRDT